MLRVQNRPGNLHDGKASLSFLRVLFAQLAAAFESTRLLEFRMDAAFSHRDVPALLEARGAEYAIKGPVPNLDGPAGDHPRQSAVWIAHLARWSGRNRVQRRRGFYGRPRRPLRLGRKSAWQIERQNDVVRRWRVEDDRDLTGQNELFGTQLAAPYRRPRLLDRTNLGFGEVSVRDHRR